MNRRFAPVVLFAFAAVVAFSGAFSDVRTWISWTEPHRAAVAAPFVGGNPHPSGIGAIPFATPALLSASSTNTLQAGALAWVTYQGGWRYQPTSTATPDGKTVVAASNGGNWIRESGGFPGASRFTQWETASTGNDANDCRATGPTHACATIAEILRRIAKQPIDSTNVHIHLGSNDTSNTEIDVVTENGYTLNVDGDKTTVATYVISAVTNWASGTIGTATLTGAPNLTTLGYTGVMFARIAAGTRAGNFTPIGKDLGSGQFRHTMVDINSFGGVNPVATTDSFIVYSLTKLGGDVRISNTGYGYIQFNDLDIGTIGASHSTFAMVGAPWFVGCNIRGFDVYPGVWQGLIVGSATFDHRIYGLENIWSSTMNTVGGAPLSVRQAGAAQVYSRSLVQGAGVSVGNDYDGPGHLIVADWLAIADYSSGAGITVYPGSNMLIKYNVWLTATAAAATGIVVYGGGGIRYDTGFAPSLLGTVPTTAYTIGGLAKIVGLIPFFDVLSGGGVTINQ